MNMRSNFPAKISLEKSCRWLRHAASCGALMLFVSGHVAAADHQETVKSAAQGLQLRSIGPALMGGRIADIAVHPQDQNTWYVAAASGGTINAGVSWSPVFDEQPSYSIGDVTIDPRNPDVIWVGTGENVSGRHVGWGDGVYKSADGGKTWARMGLENSEHIGKILIDPRDSNVVYVAAEGPLWSEGGDRGLYKSIDGGARWQHILAIDENTGITDVEFNPANPDVIYAAAYERRRHVWGLLAGGPNGGIFKSSDRGANWKKLTLGLPSGDVGKIGLAVTAADPALVYATIEADDENKGFYRSADQGESWVKMNSYLSGGTGPHYYQELTASPQTADLVYQMDVFMQVTRDGGKNFEVLGTGREKHSDNHAFWVDPRNDLHLLAGSDAGLYESFDQGVTWRHFPNLPISQFYKVAVDNAEPFYNLLGGAQDLGTLFGPSRTLTTEGVRNQDWYVPLGADGYGVVFDPDDGNVSYMEYQQGYMFRHHRDSNELVQIQPQPAPGEPPERWNWDTPILISPHQSSRIYVGSQRLWRSDDRGNSWRAVSADLTTNQNRYELEYQGRSWSIDDLHDNGAMSVYSTLSALSESPVREGVLFTGSDDGLIHSSTDGGANWQRAGELPDVPARSFINDIEASIFDEHTVFAVADAHKVGDFSPYVFMSANLGKDWRSISGDLPQGLTVWAIQQDHESENLLFLGTEFGLYFTVNAGRNWHKLNGAPTIAFRDIKLQRRDNDLVGATFGRGFYILDDYSPLRQMAAPGFGESAVLFPVRDTWWYIPSAPSQAVGMPTLGSDSFVTPNPEFGAHFTYYLASDPDSRKKQRRSSELTMREKGENIPFPGWDRLNQESLEIASRVMILVSDDQGNPVRWLAVEDSKGTHRAHWDLRYPPAAAVDLSTPGFVPPWVEAPQGPLAAPGQYTAQLVSITAGSALPLGEARGFTVKPVQEAADGGDYTAMARFRLQTRELLLEVVAAGEELSRTLDLLNHMKAAALLAPRATPELFGRLDAFGVALRKLQTRLSGDTVRSQLNESISPAISYRAYNAAGAWQTTQAATETQKNDLTIAREEFADFKADLELLLEQDLRRLEADLAAAGAPSWR
jgi:photosystem II stability/assembly factor-like uncharacterized protein